MARITMPLGLVLMAGVLTASSVGFGSAQSSSGFAGVTSLASSAAQGTGVSSSSADAQARRRAARRRRRALAQRQQAGQTTSSSANQAANPVGPTSAQRRRDAQILAAQTAQSAETARENDAVTQKAARDQQQQQAEPRIQDAPGPGSQPLPGDPAVQPVQPANAPRIQDAPGPAQTLPKPPPPPQP